MHLPEGEYRIADLLGISGISGISGGRFFRRRRVVSSHCGT
jgi:hypothetical protein